ncbi:hypothetical protein CLV49_3358 [Labedella gwakjiensis]|uniref:Uncharacterized protein n=1 Tax=Labedella gwakjiensis TaxID=390269 RepID=A0A2P8H0G1_9MICO|nr:hypothetical protein [Labedella gwakjiensis]PSL39711.1 hypothetical protein CLV49_3358 [Labedella gwakjiensis]RUQ85903.1 hypothetical protein ELQ93_02465 [Labedella gwakjiensis]
MNARDQRRLTRARALWTFAASAFTVASAIAFGLGRPGLGVAFLVGLTICLGGLTRAGRSTGGRRG